jgi:hypothetical protein
MRAVYKVALRGGEVAEGVTRWRSPIAGRHEPEAAGAEATGDMSLLHLLLRQGVAHKGDSTGDRCSILVYHNNGRFTIPARGATHLV